MIGKVVKVDQDGKMCWRQEVSNTQYHLRNWKMMLWLVASLLTVVEGGFSEEDTLEAPSETLLARDRSAWRITNNAQAPAEERNIHTSRHTVFEDPSLLEEGEAYQSRWQRSPPDSASPRPPRRNRKKNKKSHRDCRMEKKEMRVRDLGLGFDSDEIVLFKYCVGTCQSARRNYDLALKALTENGSISGRKVSPHPCCRPTRYETVSFMDTQTIWQTIKWLSAANCSCVG